MSYFIQRMLSSRPVFDQSACLNFLDFTVIAIIPRNDHYSIEELEIYGQILYMCASLPFIVASYTGLLHRSLFARAQLKIVMYLVHIVAWRRIMVWRQTGDKPLSEPIMVRLLTYMRLSAPCHNCRTIKAYETSFWITDAMSWETSVGLSVLLHRWPVMRSSGNFYWCMRLQMFIP